MVPSVLVSPWAAAVRSTCNFMPPLDETSMSWICSPPSSAARKPDHAAKFTRTLYGQGVASTRAETCAAVRNCARSTTPTFAPLVPRSLGSLTCSAGLFASRPSTTACSKTMRTVQNACRTVDGFLPDAVRRLTQTWMHSRVILLSG